MSNMLLVLLMACGAVTLAIHVNWYILQGVAFDN